MSGRFPGANNISQLWDNLKNGVSTVSEIPKERWDIDHYYDPDMEAWGKSYSKWGGFIEDVDKFDPLFFRISPVEAELMDPQQRLFLQECWTALEDAGYTESKLNGAQCGIYLGISGNEYQTFLRNQDWGQLSAQSMLGTTHSILSSRIAYFLNLKGPALAFDSACSSALSAVHFACKTLQLSEADIMLAGGTALYLSEEPYIMMSKAGMLSPKGKCSPFDNKADGIVVGEAIAAVVLKRLDKALEDGDPIYGVIKASGLNQDGKTNGITAPSADSQKALEHRVYKESGINPETISYIETHGTGTKLGDPIEIAALSEVYRRYTQRVQYCPIGSVKSNVGHTSAVAGLTGLIKTLLSMKHKKIPPSLNYSQGNEHIAFETSPFYVNTQLKDWHTEKGIPRRAALSAFGFSGTNAHLVMEEAPAILPLNRFEKKVYLIPLSAKSETALECKIFEFEEWLNQQDASPLLADISYTLICARNHFAVRYILVVKDMDELKEQLKTLSAQKSIQHLFKRKSTNKLPAYSANLKQQAHDSLAKLRQGISPVNYHESLKTLAEAYLQGYNLDWDALFIEAKHYKLSLPPYPFEKQRYWVPEVNNQNEMAQKAIPKTELQKNTTEDYNRSLVQLHPLVHENQSTLREQFFVSHWQGDEFFLSDHKILDEKILPGVAYLEMARFAGSLQVKIGWQ